MAKVYANLDEEPTAISYLREAVRIKDRGLLNLRSTQCGIQSGTALASARFYSHCGFKFTIHRI